MSKINVCSSSKRNSSRSKMSGCKKRKIEKAKSVVTAAAAVRVGNPKILKTNLQQKIEVGLTEVINVEEKKEIVRKIVKPKSILQARNICRNALVIRGIPVAVRFLTSVKVKEMPNRKMEKSRKLIPDDSSFPIYYIKLTGSDSEDDNSFILEDHEESRRHLGKGLIRYKVPKKSPNVVEKEYCADSTWWYGGGDIDRSLHSDSFTLTSTGPTIIDLDKSIDISLSLKNNLDFIPEDFQILFSEQVERTSLMLQEWIKEMDTESQPSELALNNHTPT